MSREVAVLEAALALRDSGTASTETAAALHEILPKTLADIVESDRLKLSGDVLRHLAADPHALAFISANIAGGGSVYKSFSPRIEVEPAAASEFVCPEDGKNPWSLPDKSYSVPECPVHHVARVPKTQP